MKILKNKYFLIVSIVLIVAAIYWFWVRQKAEAANVPIKNNNDSTTKTTAPTVYFGNAEFPLKIGSKGQQVLHVQALLNLTRGAGLVLDGNFGSATEAALSDAYPSANKQVSYLLYVHFYNNNGTAIRYYLKEKGFNVS